MSVNSGRRVEVDLPGFSGSAGLVEVDGVISLSYRPTKPVTVPIGAIVAIEGVDHEVIGSATSPYMTKFKVLTLQPVPAPAGSE